MTSAPAGGCAPRRGRRPRRRLIETHRGRQNATLIPGGEPPVTPKCTSTWVFQPAVLPGTRAEDVRRIGTHPHAGRAVPRRYLPGRDPRACDDGGRRAPPTVTPPSTRRATVQLIHHRSSRPTRTCYDHTLRVGCVGRGAPTHGADKAGASVDPLSSRRAAWTSRINPSGDGLGNTFDIVGHPRNASRRPSMTYRLAGVRVLPARRQACVQ